MVRMMSPVSSPVSNAFGPLIWATTTIPESLRVPCSQWPYLAVQVSDKNVQFPDQALLQIRNVGQVIYVLVVHLNENIEGSRVHASKHIDFQYLISGMEVER